MQDVLPRRCLRARHRGMDGRRPEQSLNHSCGHGPDEHRQQVAALMQHLCNLYVLIELGQQVRLEKHDGATPPAYHTVFCFTIVLRLSAS